MIFFLEPRPTQITYGRHSGCDFQTFLPSHLAWACMLHKKIPESPGNFPALFYRWVMMKPNDHIQPWIFQSLTKLGPSKFNYSLIADVSFI
jgi:hypothetical protein